MNELTFSEQYGDYLCCLSLKIIVVITVFEWRNFYEFIWRLACVLKAHVCTNSFSTARSITHASERSLWFYNDCNFSRRQSADGMLPDLFHTDANVHRGFRQIFQKLRDWKAIRKRMQVTDWFDSSYRTQHTTCGGTYCKWCIHAEPRGEGRPSPIRTGTRRGICANPVRDFLKVVESMSTNSVYLVVLNIFDHSIIINQN